MKIRDRVFGTSGRIARARPTGGVMGLEDEGAPPLRVGRRPYRAVSSGVALVAPPCTMASTNPSALPGRACKS